MREILGMALAVLFSAGSAGAQDWFAGSLDWFSGNATRDGDHAKAMYHLRPLKEDTFAAEQFNIALSYHKGVGGTPIYSQAHMYYKIAAQQGLAAAQFNLGAMYQNGEGVTQNFDSAVYYYRRAADQGFAPAANYLGLLYDEGEDLSLDDAEAVRWYRIAADQGHGGANTNLGVMYFNGEGTPQDYFKAHMRANIGCALGSQNGCKNRKLVAANMAPIDISEAQRRARVCMESAYKDCG